MWCAEVVFEAKHEKWKLYCYAWEEEDACEKARREWNEMRGHRSKVNIISVYWLDEEQEAKIKDKWKWFDKSSYLLFPFEFEMGFTKD